jgi:hypothetical protein
MWNVIPKRVAWFILALVIVVASTFPTMCDRYRTKQAMKDRRRDYMMHLTDSVRTVRDLYKDSVRRAQYGELPAKP